jgi:AraC-like DNA-binding protein
MDADAVLRQVGVSPSLLKSPQARVSTKQYGSLWRLVALLLDDELFGQDSRRMKSGSFAMICYSVLNCGSLRQAIEQALRFCRLILDDVSGTLCVDNHEAGLRLIARDRCCRIFGQECLLMLIHGLACWLVGKRIPITRAEFGYPEPAHSLEYRSMYTTNLTFQSENTTIYFESRYLALRIVQNRNTLKDFLRTAPERILVKYKNATSLAAKVRGRLRQSVGNQFIEFDALATAMHMTPATLRRRLSREQTSYREIKDELRRDLAIRFLNDSRRSTTEIGWDLGYSERSAFNRAFRSWTGMAPGAFRRRPK